MHSFDVASKNRLIAIPLVLVLLFDISLLATNFVISDQLEADSVNINIAGRQRMLSQRIAKSLALMQHQHSRNLDTQAMHQELIAATSLFDETLNAFIHGGRATAASGDPIQINALSSRLEEHILQQTLQHWIPLKTSILEVAVQPVTLAQSQQLNQAMQRAAETNHLLLQLMNRLTVELEQKATHRTYLLRGLQTLAVCLILLCFAIATLRVLRREKYYDSLMEKSTDIIISIDIRRDIITFISQSAYHLLGHPPNYYLRHSIDRLFEKESLIEVGHLMRHIFRFKELPKERAEVKLKTASGGVIVADMVMQLSRSEDGREVELNADLRDISERKRAEQLLAEMAHRDSLTGLPNRLLFYELAEQVIKETRRDEQQMAILFVDLDGFKAVNDQYGHQAGDALLIHIAERLQQHVRQSDTVARLGGDEFLVMLRDINAMTDIELLGRKLVSGLAEPMLIEGHECRVTASIGIAVYPQDGDHVDQLIASADRAMYQAKHAGKNDLAYAGQSA